MNPQLPDFEQVAALAETKVRLVLTVTLYFKASLPSIKNGASHVIEQFFDICEPQLNWYIDFKMSKAKAATPKLLRIPLRWLNDSTQQERTFGWFMYAAEKYDDASSFLLQGTSKPDPARYLSYLRATFPVDLFENDYGGFVDLVKDWVKNLPVHHGYCGFAFSSGLPPIAQQRNSQYVFAAAKRFPGIEVDTPSTTAIAVKNAIKGINWLTLIDDGFLARLGGVEALGKQLGPEIIFHKLPSGLMLQAGREPQTGDTNAGDRIPLYREVARALKPIRTKEHPPLSLEAGSFGDQGTLDWLRRFDD